MVNSTSSGVRQSILMLLVVCLLVGILPSVSALDLSSVPLEKVGVDWDNVDSFTKTIDTSVYGKYEIRNSVLGIQSKLNSMVTLLQVGIK